jgi:hypothetical protein
LQADIVQDTAKAVIEQDAAMAVIEQDAAMANIAQNIAKANIVQDTAKANIVQNTAKANIVQNIAKADIVQDTASKLVPQPICTLSGQTEELDDETAVVLLAFLSNPHFKLTCRENAPSDRKEIESIVRLAVRKMNKYIDFSEPDGESKANSKKAVAKLLKKCLTKLAHVVI